MKAKVGCHLTARLGSFWLNLVVVAPKLLPLQIFALISRVRSLSLQLNLEKVCFVPGLHNTARLLKLLTGNWFAGTFSILTEEEKEKEKGK